MTPAYGLWLTLSWLAISLFTVVAAWRIAVWGINEQAKLGRETVEAIRKIIEGGR